jgi:adenosylhomocysteine nucleosidase
MSHIAILAAMPSELKPLVQGWRVERGLPRAVRAWSKVDDQGTAIVAVCAGMGANAARKAYQVAERFGKPDLVISVGLAGATREDAKVGDVLAVGEVVDVQTGERFRLSDGAPRSVLATVVSPADESEKARLAESYGAALVDMEAATLARLAEMRGVSFCSFKAVSDLPGTKLPEIGRFLDAEGQLRMVSFVIDLALHPGSWASVGRLAKASGIASRALALALQSFLEHKDWRYTNATGAFRRPGL